MKYEPKSHKPKTEIELLMQPFMYYMEDVTDLHEIIDIVFNEVESLDNEDKLCLYEVFYDRTTYEELAGKLGLKAKSHAWSKTKTAQNKLKQKLLENTRFMELTNGYQ